MLTRLRVSGFKNLVDADIRFGPFTCIAGANGSGKSNLFDAIHFLGLLADRPLLDAGLSIRNEEGRAADVRNLFHRVGDRYDEQMHFDAEMIVPETGQDDLGQTAEATNTFLRYSLRLTYRNSETHSGLGALQILEERLDYVQLSQTHKHLVFPHTASTWRRSAVKGGRRGPPFISTEFPGANARIVLHQDGGSSGRPQKRPADRLPRTILSVANAAESPTATLARREMQSWRLMQLEPSSLRRPDSFTSPTKLGIDGSNLGATLYHLGGLRNGGAGGKSGAAVGSSRVYVEVANRLSELIDDVHEVWVDRDDKRELLTLYVTDRNGTPHPAMSLSDGTLRFLALAVLELDPQSRELICLEEPENGIHPERIPAMLQLLQDIATDPDEPIGPDNPLRQVIVNTHSPAVVSQVPDGSLIVAENKEMVRDGQRFKRVVFSCLPDTWRANCAEPASTVSRGKLLVYLNPITPRDAEDAMSASQRGGPRISRRRAERRVADRDEFLPLLDPLIDRT